MGSRGARLILVITACLAVSLAASAQSAPDFRDAASFVVLGSSSVINSGPTQITGNVGVSPGNVVTGLTSANFTLGDIRRDDALARQARVDSNAIDDELAGRRCDDTLEDSQLGGKTLLRGVYCFASPDVTLSGTLILNAEGKRDAVWIFLIGGTLTTTPDASVLVVGNGYDGNVFWHAGGAATIGARTSLVGNLFARASITLQTGASVFGRAISRTGPVTLNANRLSLCCAPIIVSPATIAVGTLGTRYSQTLAAEGGVAPYEFTVSSGSLPTGVILDPRGVLHGTPQQTGTFAFTVTATDTIGCSGTAAYSLEIVCGMRTGLPTGTVGTDYEPVALFEGGLCRVTKGALPPGFLPGCILDGVPDTAGIYEFVVENTDSAGVRRSRCFTIDVIECPITLLPPSPPDPVVCVRYSHTFDPTGGVPLYVFSSPPLPCGLTLSATGTLSGTPTSAGTCIVPMTITDELSRSCSTTVTITVACPPTPGEDVLLPSATVGIPYTAPLPPRKCGEAATFTGDPPAGLMPLAGALTGLPLESGTHTFPIESRTTDGCTVTHSVTIDIKCPEITLSSLPMPQQGVFYDATVVVSGGIGSYRLEPEGLPDGLETEGLRIFGTPTMPGPYAFTLNVVDETSKCRGKRHYPAECERIRVTPADDLPDGITGTTYPETTFTANGGTAPYTFTVTPPGSLPPGLELTTDGTLSGTPTAPGTYAFRIRITDANGCTTTLRFCAIDIAAPTCPPGTSITLLPAALPAAFPAVAYAQPITPAGGTAPYSFVLSDGELPPGVDLTPPGVIMGSPTATGAYSFTVTAIDANGCRGSRCYTLFVGTEIPTLSQWGLLFVAALLSIAGYVVISRS